MRPAENSQLLPSPDTNSQIFTYDLPKRETDSNQEPWDPDYSYSIPETTGVQVPLPADTRSVPVQTGKTFLAFFLLYETTQCLLDCNTSVQIVLSSRQVIPGCSVLLWTPAPPLPPRPSFMKSIPEYVILLPSSNLSRSSSQISQSDPSLSPSPTRKGNLLLQSKD